MGLVKLVVELEIEAEDASDAYELVNDVLDNGVFQEAINDHDSESCGPLHVTSCVCRQAEEPCVACGKLTSAVSADGCEALCSTCEQPKAEVK